MARILVVYYSRTGRTHDVALTIARGCGADTERIYDARPRGGLRGWIRSAWEAVLQRPAGILATNRNPADYDLVILGSPVWVGHLSSPMRRYLNTHCADIARAALFVTEGGRGGSGALAEMADYCEGSPLATVELRDEDLGSSVSRRLDAFVERIRKAVSVSQTKEQYL
ncbi:flavodoxin family protein [Sphingomonas sp. MMS24-J13]|uniref:flavodoxin family protein n=1 Tax=Sphingomonas sp. MMS24-J13 TaxID=3238686 RepID=UPI00384BE923